MDGTTCGSLSASGSYPYTATLSGTTGSATLSATVAFSGGVGFCWDYTDFLGIPVSSHWIDFYEYYSESLSATLTAGASGFSESDFNSNPAELVGGTIAEVSFYGIITISVDLHLSAEYNLTLGDSSSLTITQGSYGSASQNYSWDTGLWTDNVVPSTCLAPTEIRADGCIAVSTSNPFFGSAELRLGPELSVTFALFGSGTSSLASVTAWGFLYAELSLFYGVGNTPAPGSDLSGGQCGSDYAVEGLPTSWNVPGSYSLQWLAVCWAVGAQWGATYSALLGLLSGNIYTSPSYTIAAGPIATTVDVCDLSENRCTPVLTSTDPVSPNPSFGIASGATDTFEVITPLYNVSDGSWIGGTWAAPSCGSLSPDPSSTYEAGVLMDYQAPTLSSFQTTTCQLSFNTGLLFGISIPSMQINGVTFNVEIYGTGYGVPHSVALRFCFTVACKLATRPEPLSIQFIGSSGPAGAGSSNFTVSGTTNGISVSNLSNGTYSYVLTPPPGLTAGNSTSGTVQISGSDFFLRFNLVPVGLTFQETGLPTGTQWSVSIDGNSQSSNFTPTVFFWGVYGLLTYRVNQVPGYYVTPSNVSTVDVAGTNVTVPITFVQSATRGFLPPAPNKLVFLSDGLPTDMPFTVQLDPGLTETGSSPTFTLPNGTYNYSISGLPGFVPGIVSGTVNLTANGSVLVPFAPQLYPVAVREVGLPSGTSWSPTVGDFGGATTSPEVVFDLANGTYTLSVAPVTGYTVTLDGTFVVDGGAVSVLVYFTPVVYLLGILEQGLPVGANFTATVVGETRSVSVNAAEAGVVFLEPNGSGSYSVGNVAGWKVTLPAHGRFLVAGGPDVVRLTYKPSGRPYVAVTFVEKGLPKTGLSWYVTVGNETVASLSSKIVLSLLAGTYNFTVGPVSGYYATPVNGTLTVTTHGVTEHVTFAKSLYTVTFTESGLAGGTWSITVDGQTGKAAAGSPITFSLPNGTFTYKIKAEKGYTSAGTPNPLVVSGTATSVSITFVRQG